MEEVPGIPIIMQAYDAHKDNAQVVENICTLIMELCEYGMYVMYGVRPSKCCTLGTVGGKINKCPAWCGISTF